ncbi:hypothetical protein TRVL_08668 [Trypanosoma vivax]|nr:hypothetical protein TRVL_08668 [Trypanosoma vivax]
MAFRFSLALLVAILLNGAVLGDDSTSSGALAGADGKRNAPSRGGDAGRKSEGRARNGDKLVVLDSAPTTPSETVRKSASVARRMSGQSSLSSRNEVGNNHVGVGNELPDHPATSHEAQARVDDKHGMKLPHARRPATSRHNEGGLTSKNTKESAETLDRKKEIENVVSGIIAEEAAGSYEESDVDYSKSMYGGYPYGNEGYGPPYRNGELGDGAPSGGSPSVQNNTSASGTAPSSTTSTASSLGGDQNPVTGNNDKSNTSDGKATKDELEEKEKEKEKEEEGNEKGEELLNEQKSHENSDERETSNSSGDTNSEKVPSVGNSAFLSGSCSSVLLVAVACLCAFAY